MTQAQGFQAPPSQVPVTIGSALIYLFSCILSVALGTFWLLGFILAKGFWATLCCAFPFYAYYLVIEHFIIRFNLI